MKLVPGFLRSSNPDYSCPREEQAQAVRALVNLPPKSDKNMSGTYAASTPTYPSTATSVTKDDKCKGRGKGVIGELPLSIV